MNSQDVFRKREFIEKAEVGKFSQQIVKLVRAIEKGEEINKDEYTQISEPAFKFILEDLPQLPEEEREIVISYLLLAPSPQRQDEIIKIVKNLFSLSKERIREKTVDLVVDFMIYSSLQNLLRQDEFDALLRFFENPENQERYPEVFKNLLEKILKENRINLFFKIFANPQNQERYPEYKETLLKIIERLISENGEGIFKLYEFFERSESREKYADYFIHFIEKLLEVIEKSSEDNYLAELTLKSILNFFRFYFDASERVKYKEYIEKFLYHALENHMFSKSSLILEEVIHFFISTDNQMNFPQYFKKLIHIVSSNHPDLINHTTLMLNCWRKILLNPQTYDMFSRELEMLIEALEEDYFFDIFEHPHIQQKCPTIAYIKLEKILDRFIYFIKKDFTDKTNTRRQEYLCKKLLKFFSYTENQQRFSNFFKECLEIINQKPFQYLIHMKDFFANVENQYRFSEYFERLLEFCTESWDSKDLDIPLLLLKDSPLQSRYDNLLKKILERAIEKKRYNAIFKFFENLQNQERYSFYLEKAVMKIIDEDKDPDLFSWFFKNPENQNKNPKLVEIILSKAFDEETDYSCIISYIFENAENQDRYRKDFEEIIEKALINDYYYYRYRYLFIKIFRNPDNQIKYQKYFKEFLKKIDSDWLVLDIFEDPKSQRLVREEKPLDIRNKLYRSLIRVSDENLRILIRNLFNRYLLEENPLSLILLSPTEDIPIFITARLLNIDPLVIKSWNFTEYEKETLLPIFISLILSGVKFKFPFIFNPRYKETKPKEILRRLKEKIISYFLNLNLILLISEIVKEDFISQHFEKIDEICQKYSLEQTTKEIPFNALKEILTSVKEIKKKIREQFRKILYLNEEVLDSEIDKFLKECKYLNTILTLALHYHNIYKEGLPLLGEVLSAVIQGRYYEWRYDLNSDIVRKQLAPILENHSEDDLVRIVEKWKASYFYFKIQRGEKTTKESKAKPSINWEEILGYLRNQIINHGHFNGLFNLGEFSKFNEEDRGTLVRYLHYYLLEEDLPTLNLEEVKKFLQDRNISENKIKILIGIITLFKEIKIGKKTPKEIKSMIDRLEKNIDDELKTVVAIGQDIFGYLCQQLDEVIKKDTYNQKIKREILVSYFTEHPRTLLEIGHYPVSTCQDFASTGDLNTHLLGYITDAHIRALVVRRIELSENIDIDEEKLNNSEIIIDENNEEILINLPTGQIIKAKISKPVARRIIILGRIDNKPAILLEPIYYIGVPINILEELMQKSLEKFKKEFPEVIINDTGDDFETAPSYNPAGFYRDI